MAKRFDFGGVNLSAGGDDSGSRPQAETPFRIAILGDFSGRTNRRLSDVSTVGKRRPIEVDRDNFDEVLSRFGVELNLPLGDGGSLNLHFAELDDFHPDRIFERVKAFESLRVLRSRLEDPSSFDEAALELGLASRNAAAVQAPQSVQAPVIAPSVAELASGSLLEETVAETESRAAQRQPSGPPDVVRDFAQRVAAQHSQSTPDPRQPEILAVMDRAIGGLMRAILHNREFQTLEAGWRATFFLIRRLETNSYLKVYLIDISKAELAADLGSANDLRDSGVYRLLVESSVETPGAEPWAMIVGNYRFGDQSEDAALLAKVAQIARRAGAPFIAQASPSLVGCTALESGSHSRDWKEVPSWWPELRHSPEAEYLALALPRFLLRLPYGKKTSPLESFDFEEFSDPPAHEDYLWGDPAFAVALLLGHSFGESGWQMRPGTLVEIDRLPLYPYMRNGESQAKPCAEVLLTEDLVEAMIEAGLIPLVSFKNRDLVRVARFQSIADPPRPLAGPWQAA